MLREEKRASPRYALEAEIEEESDRGVAKGRCSNLSKGGLLAVLSESVPMEATLKVRISLIFDEEGHSEPLALPIRAVWSTPIGDEHQVGCQFLPLDDDDTNETAESDEDPFA